MERAQYIDHTMLKPEASEEVIKRYCEEAKKYGFCSVCVNTTHIKLIHSLLKDSEVKCCCVVGFPLGAMITSAKAFEAKEAVKCGADEIDMVINIGALKDKNYDLVKEDIKAVVDAVKSENSSAIVKVIIETCLLTEEEKVKACELSAEAKADFVKTSTGFSTGGATVEDVKLMKKVVGHLGLKVKASGGIRTPEYMDELMKAGADRIGAGNGVILL